MKRLMVICLVLTGFFFALQKGIPVYCRREAVKAIEEKYGTVRFQEEMKFDPDVMRCTGTAVLSEGTAFTFQYSKDEGLFDNADTMIVQKMLNDEISVLLSGAEEVCTSAEPACSADHELPVSFEEYVNNHDVYITVNVIGSDSWESCYEAVAEILERMNGVKGELRWYCEEDDGIREMYMNLYQNGMSVSEIEAECEMKAVYCVPF